MSYYTYFEFSYSIKDIYRCDHIKSENAKYCPECGISLSLSGLQYQLDSHLEMLDWWGWINENNRVPWYSCESDLERLSKLFPTVLFTLKGHGEDLGRYDIWVIYAYEGKIDRYEPEIIFPKHIKFR